MTRPFTYNDPRRVPRPKTRRHRVLEYLSNNGPTSLHDLAMNVLSEPDEYTARFRMSQALQGACNARLVTREGPVVNPATLWSLTPLGILYLERAESGKRVSPEFLIP